MADKFRLNVTDRISPLVTHVTHFPSPIFSSMVPSWIPFYTFSSMVPSWIPILIFSSMVPSWIPYFTFFDSLFLSLFFRIWRRCSNRNMRRHSSLTSGLRSKCRFADFKTVWVRNIFLHISLFIFHFFPFFSISSIFSNFSIFFHFFSFFSHFFPIFSIFSVLFANVNFHSTSLYQHPVPRLNSPPPPRTPYPISWSY